MLFPPHAELRQEGPYGSVSGWLLMGGGSGSVDSQAGQWLHIRTRLVYVAINQPGSLGANGAAEQVVTKESIDGWCNS